MRKPQVNGDKVVLHYTDKTSMVLKNYLDMSAQRLSKIKAGSHLPEVLNTEAPVLSKKPQPAPKVGLARSQSPQDGAPSHRSDKGAGSKTMHLSKFMEDYLSQRDLNEGVLSKKENNIKDFFKEKYGLMGKYLGEDVLKDGLLSKSPNKESHHHQEKPKKNKNIEAEIRDQYLLSLVTNTPGEKEMRSTKVMKINKQIMDQILQEERDEELNALQQLQTQQNMEVFNGLQDFGLKFQNKKMNSTIRVKTPPSKKIVKGNFLRTFINIGNGSPVELNDGRPLIINPPPIRPKTYNYGRPQSDYLIFRTHHHQNHILPDIPKISCHLEVNKFGRDSTMYGDQSSDAIFASPHLSTTNAYLQERGDGAKSSLILSNSKIETPYISGSEMRNKKESSNHKSGKDISIGSRPDFSMINDEIEFLYYHKSGTPDISDPIVRKPREPVQYFKQIPQPVIEPMIPLEDIKPVTEQPNKETEESPVEKLSKEKKKLKRQITQGLTVKQSSPKSPLKAVISLRETKFDSLQAELPARKKLSQISPKLDASAINLSIQPTSVKPYNAFKRDIKNFYSRSVNAKVKPKRNSNDGLDEFANNKYSLTTKLVKVKKEDVEAPTNTVFFTSNQVPTAGYSDTNGKIPTEGSATHTSAMVTKTNYGPKYWKNFMHD